MLIFQQIIVSVVMWIQYILIVGKYIKTNVISNEEFRGKASDLGAAFVADEKDDNENWIYNNGYPVLKWQKEHGLVNNFE